MTKSVYIAGAVVILAGNACSAQRQNIVPQRMEAGRDSAAARLFVQTFYDWYAPLATSTSSYGAWIEALRRDTLIHANLANMLRGDSAARHDRSDPREIFDGDPFLTGQDPCAPYVVEGVKRTGDRFLVSVRATCPDLKGSPYPIPVPVVEVAHNGTRWEILNVHYEKGSLIGYLCQYAREDDRPEKRPTKCGPP